MTDFPLVSVLVPIYQTEIFIERCARSVFEQTYKNLEYVFVDDGTTDNSICTLQRVIDDYPERKGHCKIIKHVRNQGLAATRNTAIANCHGDFVCHVDSDDWIEPNAVQLLVEKQHETGADIVYTRGNFLHTDKTVKIDCKGWSSDRDSLLETFLQDKATICVWSKLIRKSLYTDYDVRCDEQGSYYEDYQTLARLIYYSRSIACLNAYIYHYDRSNSGSIVSNFPNSLLIQRQGLRSIKVVCDFFRDKESHYYELSMRFYWHYILRILKTNCLYCIKKIKVA